MNAKYFRNNHWKVLSGAIFMGSGALLSSSVVAADYCTDAPKDGEIYKIVNVGADKLLAAEDGTKKANVQIEANTGLASQRFYLNQSSDSGGWAIKATDTGYAVTVDGGSKANGGNLLQKPYSESASQEWSLQQDASGSYSGAYQIVNLNSSLAMTVAGADEGANVYQNEDAGVSSQRWWLEPVNADCDGGASVSLSGSAGDGSVTLSWTDSGTGSTYQIMQDTDGEPSGRVRVGKVSSSTHSYTATGLNNGTTYYFWIKFKNSDGTSSDSNVFSATPSASSSGGSTSTADISSSAAAPTAAAASKAGANRDPMVNGFPSFITAKVSGATVVSSVSALESAISSASGGDVIYIREGTYSTSSTIELTESGNASKPIVLSVYPGDDRPVFNFSSQSESSNNRGFELSGSYWHIYGFDIKNAGDNGMFVSGSHNTIEFMSFYRNSDTGLQLGNGAAYNFVKNSDSYYNADSSLENADGFAAKLTVGTGNYFYGCRAWQNLDDGFDGYLRDNGSTILTTHEYTWMIRNGYQENGSLGVGDGNGFKTGGSDNKDLAHNGIYINTIAAGNTADGYDQNSNRGSVTIYNAVSYKNSRNFGLGDSGSREFKKLTIKNSISYNGSNSDQLNADSMSVSKNSWQVASVSSSDFQSLDIDELLQDRQEDGSLPVIDFFHLKSGSDLIDAGTDVGLNYNGSAPDLGSFESN
ncbi:RICIN domain-containing protein [Marinomonas mediterranea]|jgi:Fibronectin type III domain./Ricin-type beta-trefoil lectin domain.|uniref:Pectate lyase n=1 Tax=Marinomonas mediterranea (strain ATCC 700492 / JCM 21426 / NBRC 103028 / MMB-1) TaxID=717774 RepID=F2JXH3_MARM1|nr:RICIN domain-containing protein [Marinomonas mediterranea]ADZ91873.1 Pectate lyase [Marinomonas mediterranea MMB-1]